MKKENNLNEFNKKVDRVFLAAMLFVLLSPTVSLFGNILLLSVVRLISTGSL